MNYKFPARQEFKARRCFQCHKKIDLAEFMVRNKTISKERLIELWENDTLEYYCCLCYDTLVRNQELKEKIKEINVEELEVIRIIERRYNIKIPVVSEIKYNTIG
ncbi:MAG: hypothetical protein EU539_12045, partial [Promethearchaeota archaeon]